MINRYKEADVWWDNTYIKKEAFERLEDLMKYNDAITSSDNYETLVKNDFNE